MDGYHIYWMLCGFDFICMWCYWDVIVLRGPSLWAVLMAVDDSQFRDTGPQGCNKYIAQSGEWSTKEN